MDKKLPSGTISELPKQASGTEKIPEKVVFGNSKETATSSTLITHLHESIPTSDTLGKNGDIDITDNKISESQTKISGKPASAVEMQQVDSPKERMAPILKSSFSEDIPKQKSHTTTIQFAEISVDAASSTTRIARETSEIMKTDLQRSSTVPEISLRKEPVEEPVETVSTTYVDLTQLSLDETNQPSSLLDWNSDKHTLYRNKTEVRSVGDLSLHTTDKTDSEKEQSSTKIEKISSVSEKGTEEVLKSKDAKPSVEKGTSEFHTEKMVSEKMPSKTVISDTSPSHVCISLKNDIDLKETKQSIKETISTFDDAKSLPFKETEEFLTRDDDLRKKSEKMSEVEKRISDNNQINSAISQQKQDMTVKDQKQKDNILIKADDLSAKEKEATVLAQQKIADSEIKTSHKEISLPQKFEETIPKTESTITKSTVITVQEKQTVSDKDVTKKEVGKDEKETIKTEQKIINTVEDSISNVLIKDLKTELKSQTVLSETTSKPGEFESKPEDKSKTLIDESKKEIIDLKEKECLPSVKSQKEIQSSSLPQEECVIQASSLIHKEKQLLAKETDVTELSKESKDKEKLSDAVKENDLFVTTAIVHKEEKLQELTAKEKEENVLKKQIPQKIESEVSQSQTLILKENGTLPTEVSVSKIEDLSKSIKEDTVKDKIDEEKFICDKENIYPSHISTKEILEEKLDHVHKEPSIVPQTKTSAISAPAEKSLEKFVDHPSTEKIDLSEKSLEGKSIVSSKDEEQLTSAKQMIPQTKPDVSIAKQIHEELVAKEIPTLPEKEMKIPSPHKEIHVPPSKASEDGKTPPSKAPENGKTSPSKALEDGKATITEISQQKSLEDEAKFSAKEKDILPPLSTVVETKNEISQLSKESQNILSEISKKQTMTSEICQPKEPVGLKESPKSQEEPIKSKTEIKSEAIEEKLVSDVLKDEESGKDQILSNVKDSETKKTTSVPEVGIQPLSCKQPESQIIDSFVDTKSVAPLTDTITSKTVQTVDTKEIKVSDKNDKNILQEIHPVETKIPSKPESFPINIESEKQQSKSLHEEYLLFSSIVSDSSTQLFQESESLKSKDFIDKNSSHLTKVPKEPVESVPLIEKESKIIASKEKEIKMPQSFDSKEPFVSTDKYDSFVPPKEVPLPSYSDIEKEKQIEKPTKEIPEERLLSQLKEKQIISEKIKSEDIASKLVSEKQASLLGSEERAIEELDKSLNTINILKEKIESKPEEKQVPCTKEYPITTKVSEVNEKKESEKIQEGILKEIPVFDYETQKEKDKLPQVKESVLPQSVSKTEHEEIFSKIIDQKEKMEESKKEMFPKMEPKRKEAEKEEKMEEPEEELFLKMKPKKLEPEKEEKTKEPEKELFLKMESKRIEPEKEEKTKEPEKELFLKMESKRIEPEKEEKTKEPEKELFLKMESKRIEPEKGEKPKEPEKELFPKMEPKRIEPEKEEKPKEPEKELFPKMEPKRIEPEKEEKPKEPEKELFPKMEPKRTEPEKVEKPKEPEKELFPKRIEPEKEEKPKEPEKELFPKRAEPEKEEKPKEPEKELFPKMEPKRIESGKVEKPKKPEKELFPKIESKKTEPEKEEKPKELEKELFPKRTEPEKEEKPKEPEKELFPKMEPKRKETEKEVPSTISKEVPLQIAEKPKEKELELSIDSASEISKSTKELITSSDISQAKQVITKEEKVSDVSEKVSMQFEPKNKELIKSVIKDSVGDSKPSEKQEILEKSIESKDKDKTVQELLLENKDLISNLKKETIAEELRTLKQTPESPQKTDKTEIKDKELSHILSEINYKETIEKETLEKQITILKDKPTSPISSPKKISDKQSLPLKTETPQIHPTEKTKEELAIQSKTQSSKQKQRPLPTVGISPSHTVSTKELVETKEPTEPIMHDVNEHKIPSELPPIEPIVNKQLVSEPSIVKSEDVKTIPESEKVSVSDKVVTDVKTSLEKDVVVTSENGAPLEQETEEKPDGSKTVSSMPPLVPEDKDSQETVLLEAEETLTEETVAKSELPSETKTIVNDVEMKILEGEVCLKVEVEKKDTEESTIEKEHIHLVTDVTNIAIESEREDKDTSQDESAPSSRIDDKTESVEKDTEITPKKPKKSDVPLSKEDKRKRRKFKKKEEKPFSPDRSKQISKEADKIAEQESTEKIPKSPVKKRVGRPHRSLTRKETDSTPDSSKSPPSPSKQPLQKVTSSPKKTPYARNGLLSPSKSLKGDQRKIPPIKAPVGFAPNPNLKNVKSKIGSFDNIHYKPKGGDKKVITVKKLEWHATSKIKSLENANYKPGGGDKKIATQKLEFKDKAQSKQGDSESDTDTIETLKGDKKSFLKSLKNDDETSEAQQPIESGSTDAPTTQDETTEATSPTTTTTQEVIPTQDVTA